MKTKNFNFKPAVLLFLAVILLGYVACTRVEDDTRSASLLLVTDVLALPGTEGEDPGDVLLSDTCDNPNSESQLPEDCLIVNDDASITFRNEYLQVGPGIGTGPTFLNDIIVNRYRVDYFRPNNRNTPGIDVPFGIDGTMDQRVAINSIGIATIIVVRHVAKREPPLAELDAGREELVLTANAQMKFFGRDISGRTVSAIGFLEIHFANYGEDQ